MKYWISEYKYASIIRLHEGSCGHCKCGEGRDVGVPASSIEWHGPHHSLRSARAYAMELADERKIDDDDVEECWFCLSGKPISDVINKRARYEYEC